jgi:hypothetical protein
MLHGNYVLGTFNGEVPYQVGFHDGEAILWNMEFKNLGRKNEEI